MDGFPSYRRQVRFTDLGPDLQPGGTGVRQIEVIVEWTRLSIAAQSLSLRTLAAELTP